MTIKNLIIYLFITRSSVIFVFTLIYLILSKVNRYDDKKFKGMLTLCLFPFEFVIPLTIISAIAKITDSISTTMLKIIKSMIIKEKSEEKNELPKPKPKS